MKTLASICLLLLFTPKSFSQENQQALVRAAFNNYKTAILNNKGEDAINYVDQRTIKYYTDILQVVKKADSVKINSLSLIDKITVFSIRHRATKEEVIKMVGNDLFIYAIREGMVGKNSVTNNSVGEVIVNSNFAKGQLVVSGQKTPLYFHFYKEADHWKVDLTSLFPASNIAFKKIVDESGENENEYLFKLLEIMTGRKPGTDIWLPIE